MKNESLKKINFTSISDEEKLKLKQKILNSVFAYKQKRRRQNYVLRIACSLIVLLSISFFFKTKARHTSTIEGFAKTVKNDINADDSQNVKLLLNNNEDIVISEESSSITYSKSGEEIKIGNSKSINQNASNTEKIAYNTLIVPYGKRSQIKLSDGTKVSLNSGSKFIFPASFSVRNTREVYIEGEAIFDVAHNKTKPFIVKTNNHDIEVLGTTFYVSNYPDEQTINTVLKSGSVQINYTSDSFLSSEKHEKIVPRTLAVYNKKEKQIQTNSNINIDKYFSWQKGIFIFKKDPLQKIMKKISRYYNIDISINDNALANETFSGSLDLKDNVENVITIIKETTNFKYEIRNNKININK